MATVLIICPTYDHADTLFFSIASVQAQHFKDWEMVVIGDGAPDRTYQVLNAICAEDPRIRFERHAKSERYGEIYRDPVIRDSDASIVCHLSDDDIWTPDHLDNMIGLLQDADWGNQAALRMPIGQGRAQWWPINHGTATARQTLSKGKPPSVGINYVAYRREAYLRLPEGWTCAPWESGTSDVFMWAKFFRHPDLRVASSSQVSAIKFPSSAGSRKERTPERRVAEIVPWLARSATPGLADSLRARSDVTTRCFRLWCLHQCGDCESLDLAMSNAGLRICDQDARPNVAIDGALMDIPMSAEQREETVRAWTLMRAYWFDARDNLRARESLSDVFANHQSDWIQLVTMLTRNVPLDIGLKAVQHMAKELGNNRPAQMLLSKQLRLAGDFAAADKNDRAIGKRWPNTLPTR